MDEVDPITVADGLLAFLSDDEMLFSEVPAITGLALAMSVIGGKPKFWGCAYGSEVTTIPDVGPFIKIFPARDTR